MSESPRVDIGARVQLARRSMDWSQADLAKMVDLDRTAVAKIETGRRRVAAAELVRFAEALDRPIDWFVVESPPSAVSRRRDERSEWAPELDRYLDRISRDVAYLSERGSLPDPSEHRLTMPDNLIAAEQRATRVRQLVGLGNEPAVNIQTIAEGLGLLVFSLELGGEGPDGGYIEVGEWGVALIDGSRPPGRRRFTAAHELGHHLFGDAYAAEAQIGPTSESERYINAFAAHLLLPRASVEHTWRAYEDARRCAVDLAANFRVSWTAVCGQLRNLDLVTDEQRSLLADSPPTRADFIEVGVRLHEELGSPGIPPEYGRRVMQSYRTGTLSAARTTELLWGAVSEAELPERDPLPLEAWRRDFDDPI